MDGRQPLQLLNVGLYPIEFGTPDVTPITDADFDGNDEVTLP